MYRRREHVLFTLILTGVAVLFIGVVVLPALIIKAFQISEWWFVAFIPYWVIIIGTITWLMDH